MRIGAYTAVFHDRLMAEGLALLADVRLDSAKAKAGGIVPSPHLPIEQIRASADARSPEGV